MNSLPRIGILDSGVGGLSVLKELRAQIPKAEIFYFADSKFCPYGEKTADFIQKRVSVFMAEMQHLEVDLVLLACNSATIAAVDFLRQKFSLPIVGMEPAVKPAVTFTKTGIIGVLATQASFAGKKYRQLLEKYAQSIQVIAQSPQEFVHLVEQGILQGERVTRVVAEYIDPLLEAGVDVLVLGCTHYPFLRPAIEAYVGSSLEVVDSGGAVARQVCTRLQEGGLRAGGENNVEAKSNGRLHLFTSGYVSGLQELVSILLPDEKDVFFQKWEPLQKE